MKLKRFFISEQEFKNKHITSSEAFHAITVLRLREGDKIILFCDTDYDYIAEITYLTKFGINFEILEKNKNTANPRIKISLYQALAKGNKLELITQKATELGVASILPFSSKYCDVKTNTTKLDRLEKIIVSACKQSGRSRLTKIEPIKNIKDLSPNLSRHDIVLLAYENEARNQTISDALKVNPEADNIGIIVGPEGGFSTDEVEKLKQLKNLASVSLGTRILRTETAGMYMLSVLCDTLRV